MRKSILTILSVLVLAGMIFTGCDLLFSGGAETTLSINATGTNIAAERSSRWVPDPDPDPDPVPRVTFTSAQMGLERIELKLSGDESVTDSEDDTMFTGPYTVDLLAAIADQQIGQEVSIEPGTYSKIEMELSAQLDGGKTIIIEGTYDDDTNSGGAAIPFTFSTTMTEDFKIENASGFEITEEGAAVVVTFDLDQWITAAILDAATPADGSITIDESTNTTQYDAIEANIEAAGELGLDTDGDGAIND